MAALPAAARLPGMSLMMWKMNRGHRGTSAACAHLLGISAGRRGRAGSQAELTRLRDELTRLRAADRGRRQ